MKGGTKFTNKSGGRERVTLTKKGEKDEKC